LLSAWEALLGHDCILESLGDERKIFAGLTYGPDGQLNEYEAFDPEGGYKI
jgi:hypothetical protein